MKVLVEFDDRRAKFFLELLRNIRSIKVRTLSRADEALVEELKRSVKEVMLAKEGKLRLSSARDFVNEL